ncbi:MAG: hypothetical protein JKX83_04410 [Pseudomonadales bacterium]|nr:hypothetical protein [Pseudomonadales bacterium]
MRLSIFSSNRANNSWWDSLLASVLICIIVVASSEFYLGYRGYSPWVSDSSALWGSHRELANKYTNPIILVGASRIQLDIDVEELQRLSKRSVVQLAIDGQDGVPVLENLANDPLFNGTVIVALQESTISKPYVSTGTVSRWIASYEQRHRGTIAPNLDAQLNAIFQIVSNYHSIEIGNNQLFERIINGVPGVIYLKTTVLRDRYADYGLVKQPDFYMGRVLRHLGYVPDNFPPNTFDEFYEAMRFEISTIRQSSTAFLSENTNRLVSLVKTIEGRGGSVMFMRMPTDKLIHTIDERRYPKGVFWNAVSNSGVKALHFDDIDGIDSFFLPDGSHMDQSQKIDFTKKLFHEITARSWL